MVKVGDRFPSWDAFFVAAYDYCDATFQPMVKTSRKTVADTNKTSKVRKYPEELEFTSYTMECTHRGSFIRRGTGERNTRYVLFLDLDLFVCHLIYY